MDTVINGHSPVTMKFQDLADFGEFNRLFLEHALRSLKAGKTPEQAMMDLKLPDKFKDYNLTGGRGGPGGNFGVIFEELKVNNAKVFAIFVIPAHASAGSVRGPASLQHRIGRGALLRGGLAARPALGLRRAPS